MAIQNRVITAAPLWERLRFVSNSTANTPGGDAMPRQVLQTPTELQTR